MKVLIVTWSGDHRGIDGITAALEARGATVIRLDTNEFPSTTRLEHHQDARGDRVLLHNETGTHDLSDVTAIWYRRMRAGEATSKDLEEEYRKASLEEARLQLVGRPRSSPTIRRTRAASARSTGRW